MITLRYTITKTPRGYGVWDNIHQYLCSRTDLTQREADAVIDWLLDDDEMSDDDSPGCAAADRQYQARREAQ